MQNLDKEIQSYLAEIGALFKSPEDKKFHANAFRKGITLGQYRAVKALAKALTDYDKSNPEYEKNLKSTERRFFKILRELK